MLNTDKDIAYSAKCEMIVFEIQVREICTLPKSPSKNDWNAQNTI